MNGASTTEDTPAGNSSTALPSYNASEGAPGAFADGSTATVGRNDVNIGIVRIEPPVPPQLVVDRDDAARLSAKAAVRSQLSNQPNLLSPPMPPQVVVDRDDAALDKVAKDAASSHLSNKPNELSPPMPPQMVVDRDDAALDKVAREATSGRHRISDQSLIQDVDIGSSQLPPHRDAAAIKIRGYHQTNDTDGITEDGNDEETGLPTGVASGPAGALDTSEASSNIQPIADSPPSALPIRPTPISMLPPTNQTSMSDNDDPIFYPVEATLVDETTPTNNLQRMESVYDAVPVDPADEDEDESDKPWYRRKRSIGILKGCGVVSLAIIIGAVVGTVTTSRRNNPNNNGESDASSTGFIGIESNTPTISPAPSVVPSISVVPSDSPSTKPTGTPSHQPQQSPTGQPQQSPSMSPVIPAPCISNVTLDQALFEEYSYYSDEPPIVAIKGDTIVVSDASDDGRKAIYFHNGESLLAIVDEEHSDLIDYRVPKSIVITDDEQTAIVGVPDVNDSTGAVYVFRRRYDDPNDWNRYEPNTNEGKNPSPIFPDDLEYGGNFGYSLAFDIDTLLVGAPYAKSVYVYRKDDNNWEQEIKIVPLRSDFEYFGKSVAIRGNLAAISGKVRGAQRGSVHVYEYNPSSSYWVEQNPGNPIIHDNCKERYNQELGATLDITSDGGLLVGCPNSDVIYYYTRPTTGTGSYTLVQNITASEDVDKFGYDGHVALGGENDNILAVGSGSSKKLFVFTREGHKWTEVAVVAAPSGVDYTGNIAISGNKVVVASDENAYTYILEECV